MQHSNKPGPWSSTPVHIDRLALASKHRGEDTIVLAFFGEGVSPEATSARNSTISEQKINGYSCALPRHLGQRCFQSSIVSL